ncbi:metal-dependent phosphohydrolase [Pelomonas sp. APW6]|uniref:Metal-dependent phosphohydrolase n=1 Tax=Roseateles subflavus TaxID=3053353 RepID=A0ABT7LRR9_9BURK|nr:metal-dependent phosphohydrolase [Pelomonas sp. APW6]MDL5034410.1 metal-dependent phosphohydrolase [Pelomonas sp. APW6]
MSPRSAQSQPPGVKGSTIHMANGHYFDYRRPGDSLIDIETMSHSLSHMTRFTGHCSVLYVVAQHCWLMSYIVPREDAFYALMHEAAEPVTGDINKPLKMLLPDLEVIENESQRAILLQFGLDPDKRPASIKPADWRLLATEQRDFMPKRRATRWDALGFAIEWEDLPPQQWTLTAGITPLPDRIVAWTPEHANRMFLARFRELVLEAMPHLGAQDAPTFNRPPRFDFRAAVMPVAGAATSH